MVQNLQQSSAWIGRRYTVSLAVDFDTTIISEACCDTDLESLLLPPPKLSSVDDYKFH